MFSPKLKSAVYAGFFLLGVAAFPFYPVMAGQGCGASSDIFKAHFERGFAFLATAISNKGLSLVIFINADGAWQIVGVDQNLSACVVARGTDWAFAGSGDI